MFGLFLPQDHIENANNESEAEADPGQDETIAVVAAIDKVPVAVGIMVSIDRHPDQDAKPCKKKGTVMVGTKTVFVLDPTSLDNNGKGNAICLSLKGLSVALPRVKLDSVLVNWRCLGSHICTALCVMKTKPWSILLATCLSHLDPGMSRDGVMRATWPFTKLGVSGRTEKMAPRSNCAHHGTSCIFLRTPTFLPLGGS